MWGCMIYMVISVCHHLSRSDDSYIQPARKHHSIHQGKPMEPTFLESLVLMTL